MKLSPGDRVQTKSGRLGILQSSTVNMPAHHLIQFDDGAMLWVIKEAIEPVPPKKSKSRSKVRS
jgi:preprotein translocase subunit YajC